MKNLLTIVTLLSLSRGLLAADTPVQALAARLGAADGRTAVGVYVDLLKMGPTGLSAVCTGVLTPGTGDDSPVRTLLSGLALHVARPRAEAERRLCSAAFLQALAGATNREVRTFFMDQLHWCGGSEAQAPLARYLNDPELCAPAVGALLAIGAPGTDSVLLAALRQATDVTAPHLLQAVGACHGKGALEVVKPWLSHAQPALREAAARALAALGYPAARPLLAACLGQGGAWAQATAAAHYLLLAQRLADTGETGQAAAMCRELLGKSGAGAGEGARCAALGLLADVDGSAALPELLAALDDADSAVRQTVAGCLARVKGRRVTSDLAARLATATGGQRLALVSALGARRDEDALPALAGLRAETDPALRVAVIEACGAIGGRRGVEVVLAALLEGDTNAVAVATRVLAEMPGEAVSARVAEALPRGTPARQVSLIEVLRARHAASATGLLLGCLDSTNAPVRLAALQALGGVGEGAALPALLRRATQEPDKAARRAAAAATLDVAARVSDERARVAPFRAALTKAGADEQVQVLDLLARLGGTGALETVSAQRTSAAAVVREAAVRALAEWQDPAALDALLDIMRTGTNVTHNVLAARGVARLLDAPSLSPARKRTVCLAATAAARRPEEQQLLAAALAALPDPNAVNLALRKPVTTSCPAQGDKAPDRAVDGNAGLESGWWGVQHPSWLQVDLKEPADVNRVRVVFYWSDPRYYRYTVDLSADGKTWATVVDQSKTSTPETAQGHVHRFAPVRARYARVSILGNSANEAVHLLEFEVYHDAGEGAPSTAPSAATSSAAASAPADAAVPVVAPAAGGLNAPPEGFVALFNGVDLAGWKGLVGNPLTRAKLDPAQLAAEQQKADDAMRAHWSVREGGLVFDGKGNALCTARDYGDFEMLVDWKILADGDSGIYLRGSPQVQIWDSAKHPEGSGGLYNNQKNPSKPLVCADRPVGAWNTFRIRMVGERVTVDLNGQRVLEDVVMENYWDRKQPIFPTGQIELQNHGNTLEFRNLYLRELKR